MKFIQIAQVLTERNDISFVQFDLQDFFYLERIYTIYFLSYEKIQCGWAKGFGEFLFEGLSFSVQSLKFFKNAIIVVTFCQLEYFI